MLHALPAGYNAGDMVFCFFPAYGANGESLTISGLAVTDIEIYKDGGTTQRASDNGYTLLDTDGIDFDASTGLHGFKVDTSDNSDASFYADGSHYLIWVDAVTINSQTVRFGFELRLGVLLRPTTAGRKLDVSTGGEAGLDWANVGSPTTTVGLSGTTVKDATDVNTDTDTLLSRLGTPSNLGGGATVAANLSDIESQTDDIGAAGAGLTAVPWNAAWDAEVQSEVQDAIEANHLDHLIAVADPGGVVANSSFLAKLVSKSATPAFSSFDNTTDALEALRDNVGTAGAGLTAIDLPDQTMNITGNITGNLSGSVGSVTGAVGSVTGNVGGNVAGSVASVTGAVGSVTGNVGGNVTGSVGSIATGGIAAASFAAGAIDAAAIATDAIGSAELAASAVTAIQSGLATAASISALNNLSAAQVNAEVVDALATDTYAEPGQGAPAATTSLAAKINYLYKMWRNKKTQTSTTWSLMADDTTTVDQKATVSDDGTTATKGEIATGP